MGYFELIAERYSVRSYEQRAVEPEKLAKILDAGRIAPTAGNRQPHRIKVITEAGDLAKADECTPCRFNAPALLLVCYDNTACWKSPFNGGLSGEVDVSIVTTHMMLAAQELGLGTCWVMYFDPAKATEVFALPENIIPIAMLPVGYPSADAAPSEKHKDRLPVEDILL